MRVEDAVHRAQPSDGVRDVHADTATHRDLAAGDGHGAGPVDRRPHARVQGPTAVRGSDQAGRRRRGRRRTARHGVADGVQVADHARRDAAQPAVEHRGGVGGQRAEHPGHQVDRPHSVGRDRPRRIRHHRDVAPVEVRQLVGRGGHRRDAVAPDLLGHRDRSIHHHDADARQQRSPELDRSPPLVGRVPPQHRSGDGVPHRPASGQDRRVVVEVDRFSVHHGEHARREDYARREPLARHEPLVRCRSVNETRPGEHSGHGVDHRVHTLDGRGDDDRLPAVCEDRRALPHLAVGHHGRPVANRRSSRVDVDHSAQHPAHGGLDDGRRPHDAGQLGPVPGGVGRSRGGRGRHDRAVGRRSEGWHRRAQARGRRGQSREAKSVGTVGEHRGVGDQASRPSHQARQVAWCHRCRPLPSCGPVTSQ